MAQLRCLAGKDCKWIAGVDGQAAAVAEQLDDGDVRGVGYLWEPAREPIVQTQLAFLHQPQYQRRGDGLGNAAPIEQGVRVSHLRRLHPRHALGEGPVAQARHIHCRSESWRTCLAQQLQHALVQTAGQLDWQRRWRGRALYGQRKVASGQGRMGGGALVGAGGRAGCSISRGPWQTAGPEGSTKRCCFHSCFSSMGLLPPVTAFGLSAFRRSRSYS